MTIHYYNCMTVSPRACVAGTSGAANFTKATAENANGHDRQGARTSGVTCRNRGRPPTEPGAQRRRCLSGGSHRLCKTHSSVQDYRRLVADSEVLRRTCKEKVH